MPDYEQIQDLDFDAQLRDLFQEAEQSMEDRSAAARRSCPEKERPMGEPAPQAYASLPQMLRPVLLGLQAVARAAGEHTILLQKIGEKLDAKPEAPPAVESTLPDLAGSLRALLDQKNGVNQKMFAALHEELKGYKDGFLLESVHKPIIRDLISLYDDLSAIHRQMQGTVLDLGEAPGNVDAALLQRLKTMETNIEHNCVFIIEVLARLEVTPLSPGTGKLNMQTQRAMFVELAEDPCADGDLVRSLKPAFVRKGRVLRPEEVVIKKWKEGIVAAPDPSLSQ